MAFDEFVRNIQTARNVVFFNQAVHLGRNPLSPIGSNLQRTVGIWFSSRVVAGYDPNDFGFLSSDKQTALKDAVTRYREIVETVVDREPTKDEMQSVLDCLVEIVGLLDDGLIDAEGKALLDAVCTSNGKESFPDFVLGLDYSLDTDWSGDPGIWIWVIVADNVDPDSSEFQQFSRQFDKVVWRALTEIKSERLPYVRYRLLSEAIETTSEGVA